MKMPVLFDTPQMKEIEGNLPTGKSVIASDASFFVNFFEKNCLPESFINISLKRLFFIFEAFSYTILNRSQNQTIEVV